MKGSADQKEHEIAVRVSLPDDERARAASLVAYAFSQGGKLLDAKPLSAKGETTVRVPLGAEGTNVRVVVGPQLDGEARSLTELARRRATERHLRVDLDAKRLTVDIAVTLDQILCWLRSLCAVNGTVLKRTTLDGQNVDLPVCNATVEVYEVDPLFIILPKLPKSVLDRLRDIILHPIPLPDPIPDPLPGPFPGPFPPEPGPGPDPFLGNVGPAIPRRFAAAAAQQLPSSLQRQLSTAVTTRLAAERPRAEAAAALADVASASALQFAARTASDLEFRRVLLDHEQLIRPIFCLFYPYFFSLQLVATTKTDDCGHFHTLFFRGCNNPDTPDLYFKVKQRFLNLFDITIYAPTPVPCYTWWNYTCGAEVTLVTHHPLARTCPPCPPVVAGDNWVLFVAIGQKSLNAIYGNSDALQGSTTPTNRGLTKEGGPFGGNLRPQLLFDNALRENLGVMYYRLSWRRVGDPGWIQMLEDIGRHYTYDAGGGNIVSALYKLGPLSPPDAPAANLFEIPPSLPPQGVWGPVIVPTDYQNGVFNTTLPAPGITYDADGTEMGADASGKFEIQLELFDTAGNPVNIAVAGIKYVVPDVDDLTGTITTVDAATLGLVSGNAMIVTVHVDNNPTFAEIDAPAIGAVSADPCCGILGFDPSDNVTLPWRAKHKNGFATFTFQTKRVDQVVFSTPSTPVGLVGNHSTTQNAQALMDANLPPGCMPGGCNVAAFASFEYVKATATDGWTRLQYLDTSDFEAFTLSRSS
ncbi:MAG TPA: hypothetical protein VE592_05585 [Geminicoccaceae bacterium]|nr:hypothetical protein [Geminicoccaceae bacterium]